MALEKPAYIFRYNIDSNGNPISIKVDNEEKQVSPVNNTIQLEGVPDEVNRLAIIGKDNVALTEVENLCDVTDSTFYCDYHSGKVHFSSIHQGKTKVINYYQKGVELISTSRIYDEDSLGESVIKTLKDIIEEATRQLELVKSLGDAVLIIGRLEANISTATQLNTDLGDKITVGQPLKVSLNDLVPRAEIIEPKLKIQNIEANRINGLLTTNNTEANRINPILQNTIATATDLDNKISSTGAKSIQVTSAMWGSVGSDGKYHYLWKHNCASQALNIDVYEVTQNGLALATMQGYIKDNNTLELITEEITECVVVCSARYYGGQIPSLISFNTDNLVEGNNKYVQSKSYDVLANQFTSVDGLYQATLTHSLNRTKFTDKLAFVNGKQIFVDIDEISNTQVKITTNVAEAMQIKLNFIGGM